MTNKLAFIIEDDFDGSMVFAKAVEANGLEPEQIMTGNRALERIGESIPTLVVLDLHLPNVPGPDILKKIRADNRLDETLVVVVTADPRMADVIREDADLVLLKPTTFSQVRDLVGRLLALRDRNVRAAAVHSEPAAAAPVPAPIAAELAILPTPEAAKPAAMPEPVPMPSAKGDGAAGASQPAAPVKHKKGTTKTPEGGSQKPSSAVEVSPETPAAAENPVTPGSGV